jgi:hypothetical protein
MASPVVVMSAATYEVVCSANSALQSCFDDQATVVSIDNQYPLGTVTIWEREDWERYLELQELAVMEDDDDDH